jgi:amidase
VSPVSRPNRYELVRIADSWGFSLGDDDLAQFQALTDWLSDRVDALEQLSPAGGDVLSATREVHGRATQADDPYNAVVHWCSVTAGNEGPLTGVRIGVKDSVAVAGIPLTCGSKVFEGFVPTRDSVVTERILRAGGQIVCTTNMDDLATSGGGDTSAWGPTRNPFDPRRTAGGSSGGSAAALYYDDVDVTIGCDQGGSIRVPGSWCGVVGLKPTHGLVPYTRIVAIDPTYDHCGPMARTVSDAARLLQVIAGPDPSDPRQSGGLTSADALRAVAEAPDDLRGVRIGVIAEGFSESNGVQPDVIEATRAAIEALHGLRAEVADVSVPEHLLGEPVTLGNSMEGMAALIAGGGNGYHWQGEYWPELASAFACGFASSADELSAQVKLILLFGAYMQRRYLGAYYATAQNLRSTMRTGYDRALARSDVLVLPTTPGVAHEHVPDLAISENVRRGWAVLANTSATDMTGHPALTLPVAEARGLPVGLMLVGRHFDDARLLQLGRVIERGLGWRPRHPGDPRSIARV